MLERLTEILKEWLHLDIRDRKFNDKFKDDRDPETKAENEELDRQIEKSRTLLDAIEKKKNDKGS